MRVWIEILGGMLVDVRMKMLVGCLQMCVRICSYGWVLVGVRAHSIFCLSKFLFRVACTETNSPQLRMGLFAHNPDQQAFNLKSFVTRLSEACEGAGGPDEQDTPTEHSRQDRPDKLGTSKTQTGQTEHPHPTHWTHKQL